MAASVGQRKLGSQGLVISEQGFGCMGLTADGFYPRQEGFDDQNSIDVIRKALELGINNIHTAAFYGPGTNEILVGKAIKGFPREKVIIKSLWGPDLSTGQFKFDISREAAHRTIDAELQRLGVDYLDLWVYRNIGKGEGWEEAITAMSEIVKQGKVKYIGVSEMPADMIRKAHAIHPLSCVEMEWNLFTRDSERDLLPTCRELGIGILAYSPMGRGILTGNFKLDELPEKDARRHNPRFAGENLDKNTALVQKCKAIADRKGCTVGQLALAWVAHQGDDVIPIPGTKRIKYLEENVGALQVKLTPADLKELEETVSLDQVSGLRDGGGHGIVYNIK
ncbi:hypothetical protein WJX73_004851 [Symbiochloris irregularis]|uniref:NADP-dependent oxidoreductase domain-containing protein n=1 Tax=Symbiochloris irregularis TaxID=706552 RepID=A0AAW1PK01_9CHLO